jgi:hypothetical protein
MNDAPAPTSIALTDVPLDPDENRRRIDQLTEDVTRLTADLANLYAILHELVPMTDYQIALANALVRRGYLPSAAMRAALATASGITVRSRADTAHTSRGDVRAASGDGTLPTPVRQFTLIRPDR